MANELLYGLTPQDYARAEQLGYTNQSFNQLGAEGTRNALRNNTKFQPAVAAPQATQVAQSVIPQMQTTATGFNSAGTGLDAGVAPASAPIPAGYGMPDASAGYGQYATSATPATSTFNYQNPDGSFNADMFQAGTADQRKVAMDTIETQGLVDEMNRANEFDWMGAAGVGIQGANLAMNIGMYSDKKDYYENVNKGLEQNLTNAQDTHDNRAKQQTNLGSTFSRN